MVVPNRELVNILFFFDSSTSSNPVIHNNMNIDIEINTLRGWSAISSINSSRKLSVHSSVSSISYAKKIEAQNNSLSWANQVKLNKSQGLTLFYVIPEVGETNSTNETIGTKKILEQQGECANSPSINM